MLKKEKKKKPSAQFKFKIEGNKLEKKHKQYVNLDKADKMQDKRNIFLAFNTCLAL